MNTDKKLRFLDLFAGGGGLSEGFIQAGFEPIAHIESNQAACFTLRTRMAYHWLKNRSFLEPYESYLDGKKTRYEFYQNIPRRVTRSVINAEICRSSLQHIFELVDDLLENAAVDLIIGGPPCQAYSLIGRARDPNRMTGDERNYLYNYYAEFLKKYKPNYFLFENVKGLLSAKDKSGRRYFSDMQKQFAECGYDTEHMILSAKDYGVLQNRNRVVLVGKRGKSNGFFPNPTKWNPGSPVKEVLYDLPKIDAGEGCPGPCKAKLYRGIYQYEAGIRNDQLPITWHQARPNTDQDKSIYRIAVDLWNKQKARLTYNELPNFLKTHKNQLSFVDRFKVVASDLEFSQTVVAHIAKDGHYYIHPDISQNRSITPREAARLQTFPDDYYFESSNSRPGRTPAFLQIGNAVPVLLAKKLADKLRDSWS